ncbi:unnamed protein product [Schistosoma mattheei]|uniref:Uncharacterized protein n=1 Tax=Schistosoma mattheei TaxID=31246 RepID=A0A183P411_9TREM|nr:unnamed protein product [Schistosoma mattheei]
MAAREGNIRQLYDTTKELSGNHRKPEQPVKSKEGMVITNTEEQRNRRVEHFKLILNRPASLNLPNIEAAPTDLPINVGPPTIEKITMAITQIKSRLRRRSGPPIAIVTTNAGENDHSTVRSGNLKNYESHHPKDTSVYEQLSMQNTSDSLARYYQQQRTIGENKPDLSGGRNQEEEMEVDRTHIEESTQLRHKTSPHMESSRPKENRKTKEHITLRNGERHDENKQQLDRTRKEDPRQSELENGGRRPMLH